MSSKPLENPFLPTYLTVPTLLILSIALCWGAQYAARGNEAARAHEAKWPRASFIADMVCDFGFSVLGGSMLLLFSVPVEGVTVIGNTLLGTMLLIALALASIVCIEKHGLTGSMEMYARKIAYRGALLIAFFVAALALVYAGVLDVVDR